MSVRLLGNWLRVQVKKTSAVSFVVSSGVNDKVDFEETAESELTATLAAGTYTAAQMCTELKSKLEAVGDSTYTVTYAEATQKFTVVSNGVGGGGIFNILFLTGTNTSKTAAGLLGFDVEDKSGALTYTSDNGVEKCTLTVKLVGR